MSAAFRPKKSYSAYVLGALLLAYILNFVDRQLLAIAAPEVKAELGLSDTQLGLLLGFAFALFYGVAGIPIARLADLSSRRTVVAAGLALWSTMTVLCGMARSFPQLLFARFGVGVGEAAGTPPSHSLISDYFPPERRATALAIYSCGIYFGTGFGFAGGGYVLELFDWRTAFWVAGLAGLPVALLIRLTVREPPPGASESAAPAEPLPFRAVCAALFGSRAFLALTAAGACQALLGYAMLSWGTTYLRRVFELSAGDVGVAFGLAAAASGALGVVTGGALADRLAARDTRWFAWLGAIVSLLAFPFAAAFALAGSFQNALLAFALFYTLNNMYVSSLWTLVQNLARPRARATASAIQLALLNIVGYGLGPLLVGVLNDLFAPAFGAESIRISLLCVSAVGAASAIFFMLCARALPGELPRRTGAQ